MSDKGRRYRWYVKNYKYVVYDSWLLCITKEYRYARFAKHFCKVNNRD